MIAYDNFDTADADLAGANWGVRDPAGGLGWDIVSNKIQPHTYAGDRANVYTSGTFANNQYAQAVVAGVTGTGGPGVGVAVRMTPTNLTLNANTTYYAACVNAAASNNVTVFRVVADAFTQITQRTQAFSDGDMLRLEASGTTLRVFRNGVQLGADITDANIASGSPGVAYNSTITAGTLDDWEGGDITAPGVGGTSKMLMMGVG